MATAVLNYLKEWKYKKIPKIKHPQPVNASKLEKLTQALEQLAVIVDKKWNTLSQDEQDLLSTIVYDAIDSSENDQNWLLTFWRRLLFAWMVFNSGESAFVAYSNAVQRFINAVLDKIERTHPDYENQVSESLEEAIQESDNYPAMTQDEFGDWLKTL